MSDQIIETKEPKISLGKYGRSVGLEFSKPDYQKWAEEVNDRFGKKLTGNVFLDDIYQHRVGLIERYFDSLPDDKEGVQKLSKFRSAVGAACMADILTVDDIRRSPKDELEKKLLRKLGVRFGYKVFADYLKMMFDDTSNQPKTP